FNYPIDFTDNVNKGMVTKNLKGVPVEELELVNNKVVSANKTVYKDTLGLYLPHKVMKLNSTVPLALSAYNGNYVDDYFFTKYDSKGKLLEMLNRDRTYTSFLWNTA